MRHLNGRSRSRSPVDRHERRRSRSRDRYQQKRTHNGLKDASNMEKYWELRRLEREKIGANEVGGIWEHVSEPDEVDSDLESRHESDDEKARNDGEKKKHRKTKHKSRHGSDKKKRKKKKKKHDDKEKTHRKKHKKESKKSESEENSHASGSECEYEEVWTEKRFINDEDDVIGPSLEPEEAAGQLDRRDYGKALLPGEGAAMAAYIADGKRIPRRGEIGLTCDEISNFEDLGYVMSGSRHRRMEAVRLRKENQIYSADEKRALTRFDIEERKKREAKIMSQFRELVHKKTKAKE